MDALIYWLEFAGIAVFAASGALEASRRQLDIVGFVLVGSVTGIGGGTLRDLLLGRDPVYWVAEPHFLYLTSAVSALVYFTAHQVESRFRVLLWADAVGLALFAVTGAKVALTAGTPPAVAVLMGVMSATFGGLIRDVVCNTTPLILRREVYATAAAAGAGTFVALTAIGAPPIAATAMGFAVGFATRAAALLFGISVPVYKPRPGRDYPDRRGHGAAPPRRDPSPAVPSRRPAGKS